MSIIIENLSLPDRGCLNVQIWHDGRVTLLKGGEIGKAIELPDHGDLIDRDALPKYTGYALSANEVANAVINANAVIPAERSEDAVNYESSKSGEWRNKMKGYKGFSKGMVCRGKQYAENTVYEEDEAKICESGMHFCENPYDVWKYYGPTDNNGNLNEFAEVEAEDAITDDGEKFVTKKLKIGAKLSFSDFVKAGVEFILEKQEGRPATNTGNRSAATNTGNRSAATNTGDWSAATNTGDRSAATNTGNWSAATNTGNRSAATNTGNRSAATNTGDGSAATNTGDGSAATNTGDWSAATNTGNWSAATNTGDWSAATNTGNGSAATNTGNRSAATNTGNWSAATNTGDGSAATNTGNGSAASVEGADSIAIVTGRDSKAKGAKGNWLVLTERDDNYKILGVVAVEVDGEKVKADTWYKLKNGEVVEV